MALTSALFTGLSGLNVNQTKLQVVGNIPVPLGALPSAKEPTSASLKGNLNAKAQTATGASILTSHPLALVGGGVTQPAASDAFTNIASASGTAPALFTAGQVFTLE